MSNLNWDKIRKTLDTRKKGGSSVESIVGLNKTFWVSFYENNFDKLEELIDCIVYDLRETQPITWENECYVKTGLEALKDVIRGCHEEEQMRIKIEKDNDEKKERIKNIRKII